ncbi:MAG: cobalt-precorrin-6A reductase [Pseudomonadota bacterium]|nr:cobalt-precorrin-6A reductase [Pseudomonadota bacterium]
MKRLLILGGTADAVELAKQAHKIQGLKTIYSLAGRTQTPNTPKCDVRIGGFGGAPGLRTYLNKNAIDFVIDATHPFATIITNNIINVCAKTNIPLLKYCRKKWIPGDISWTSVNSYSEAAQEICVTDTRIFLSIGTKLLDQFSSHSEKWFLIRTIEKPDLQIPLKNYEVLVERGPFDIKHEIELLISYQINLLICKNSGGNPPTKLRAAHNLGIKILMIEQPTFCNVNVVYDIANSVAWIYDELRT